MKQLLRKLGWNIRREISEAKGLGELLRQRLEGSPLYAPPTPEAPLGFFNGRHIIGKSTRVQGGVYIGILPQEAVVVDDKYRSLNRAFDELMRRLLSLPKEAQTSEGIVLRAAVEHAERLMKVDYSALKTLSFHLERQDDQKVMLDAYLDAGAGAPRHLVLLKAYFLEKLKDRGLLNGSPELHISITNNAYVLEEIRFESIDGSSFKV